MPEKYQNLERKAFKALIRDLEDYNAHADHVRRTVNKWAGGYRGSTDAWAAVQYVSARCEEALQAAIQREHREANWGRLRQ
jgi:hypothetical protein